MSLFSDKKIAGLAQMHDMKKPLGQVSFFQSYCVKFACDYDETRHLTDNFSRQTLLELVCLFLLWNLSA